MLIFFHIIYKNLCIYLCQKYIIWYQRACCMNIITIVNIFNLYKFLYNFDILNVISCNAYLMTFFLRRHDKWQGLILFRVPVFSLVTSHITVLVALLMLSLLLLALLLMLLLVLLLLLRLHGGHVYRRRFWGLKHSNARSSMRGQLIHLVKIVFRGSSMRAMGHTTYGPDLRKPRGLWRRGPTVEGPPWPVWATGWLRSSSVDYFRPGRFSFEHLARQKEVLIELLGSSLRCLGLFTEKPPLLHEPRYYAVNQIG